MYTSRQLFKYGHFSTTNKKIRNFVELDTTDAGTDRQPIAFINIDLIIHETSRLVLVPSIFDLITHIHTTICNHMFPLYIYTCCCKKVQQYFSS